MNLIGQIINAMIAYYAGDVRRINHFLKVYGFANCHYSFREENHFTPGPLHCSYSLLNQVARDIANLHFTYKDIAEKNNVSIGSVELYSDSFLNVPRLTLPENIGMLDQAECRRHNLHLLSHRPYTASQVPFFSDQVVDDFLHCTCRMYFSDR